MSGKKYVCSFNENGVTGPELLGIKGAKLAETAQCGIPVPAGFTVTTDSCSRYYDDGKVLNDEIADLILAGVSKTEILTDKRFGDPKSPLLVSVRSYSRQSVPGLMDTIVNLGLNDEITEALANRMSDPKAAYENYIQFIKVYSNMVRRFGKKQYAAVYEDFKTETGKSEDAEFTVDDLKILISRYKNVYRTSLGENFPGDPMTQLMNAVSAGFHYWDSPRANYYRMVKEIPYSWGTAVTIQAMVFGNIKGGRSGNGIAYTRNPSTGKRERLGEFLFDAKPGEVLAEKRETIKLPELESLLPECYEEFVRDCALLEAHYKDMQEISFTVEDGTLYIIKTRKAKRTGYAALMTACDFVDEGICSEKEAIHILDPKNIIALRPDKAFESLSDDNDESDSAIIFDMPEFDGEPGVELPMPADKSRETVSESAAKTPDDSVTNENAQISEGGIYTYSSFDYQLDDIMTEIYSGFNVYDETDDADVTAELRRLIEKRAAADEKPTIKIKTIKPAAMTIEQAAVALPDETAVVTAADEADVTVTDKADVTAEDIANIELPEDAADVDSAEITATVETDIELPEEAAAVKKANEKSFIALELEKAMAEAELALASIGTQTAEAEAALEQAAAKAAHEVLGELSQAFPKYAEFFNVEEKLADAVETLSIASQKLEEAEDNTAAEGAVEDAEKAGKAAKTAVRAVAAFDPNFDFNQANDSDSDSDMGSAQELYERHKSKKQQFHLEDVKEITENKPNISSITIEALDEEDLSRVGDMLDSAESKWGKPEKLFELDDNFIMPEELTFEDSIKTPEERANAENEAALLALNLLGDLTEKRIESAAKTFDLPEEETEEILNELEPLSVDEVFDIKGLPFIPQITETGKAPEPITRDEEDEIPEAAPAQTNTLVYSTAGTDDFEDEIPEVKEPEISDDTPIDEFINVDIDEIPEIDFENVLPSVTYDEPDEVPNVVDEDLAPVIETTPDAYYSESKSESKNETAEVTADELINMIDNSNTKVRKVKVIPVSKRK
ncbi:MAG: hypothetical protein LBM87_01620 [Ruminococcus sp.]|nr:hypothetical protein [Ruminococcus sp.]